MFHKKSYLTMAVAALMVVSVGCSTSKQTAATSQSDVSKGTVELRFAYWGGGARVDLYNKILDNFEKKNPYIKVKREVSDFGPYWEKMAIQTAAGNSPDVFQQHLERVNDYAQRGQLMPLDELAASGKINISGFNKNIVDSGRIGGKIVMVTMGNSILGNIYNEKVFEETGVKPPTWDMTWDDLIQKSIEITKAVNRPNFWGIEDAGGYDRTFGHFVRQRGRDFYNEQGRLGFTKEDMIDYLSIYDKLRKANAAPPANVTAEFPADGAAEKQLIVKGQVAMNLKPSNQVVNYGRVVKDAIAITRMPQQPKGKNGETYSGAYLSISPKTKHLEEAAKLINYFVADPEAGDLFLMEQGVPGSKSINEHIKPLLTKDEVKITDFVIKAAEYSGPSVQPPAGNQEVIKLFKQANEYVGFGKKSIPQAVDDFLKEAQNILP